MTRWRIEVEIPGPLVVLTIVVLGMVLMLCIGV